VRAHPVSASASRGATAGLAPRSCIDGGAEKEAADPTHSASAVALIACISVLFRLYVFRFVTSTSKEVRMATSSCSPSAQGFIDRPGGPIVISDSDDDEGRAEEEEQGDEEAKGEAAEAHEGAELARGEEAECSESEVLDSWERDLMQSGDDDGDDDDDEDWGSRAGRRTSLCARGERAAPRTRRGTARGEERQDEKTYVAVSKIEAVCKSASLDVELIGLTGEGLFAKRAFAQAETVVAFSLPQLVSETEFRRLLRSAEGALSACSSAMGGARGESGESDHGGRTGSRQSCRLPEDVGIVVAKARMVCATHARVCLGVCLSAFVPV